MPDALRYRRYWDDQEYRTEGLQAEIADVIRRHAGCTPEEIAAAIDAEVFDRVKLRDWCDRGPTCTGVYCTPTHYAIDVATKPREFRHVPEEANNDLDRD